MQFLSLGLVIAATVALLQTLLGLDTTLSPFRISLAGEQFDRIVGLQASPWIFSFINGIAVLLFIGLNRDAQWWRNAYIRYGLIFLSLICIMLAQIRAPMVALVVAVFILYLGRLKHIDYKIILLAIFCSLVLFSIAAYLRDSMFAGLTNFSGRTSIWPTTLEIIRQNPLWGVGHLQFMEHYQQAWDIVWGTPESPGMLFLRNQIGHPHQDYLNLAVYYGIPALIAYLCFLFSLINWAWKIRFDDPETSRLMFAVLAFVFIAGLAENYLDYTASFYMMISAYVLLYKRHQLKISSTRVKDFQT